MMQTKMEEPSIVAVVLAAGASSRMGRSKALLDFHGQTCLSLVLSACAGVADHIVLVTAPDGQAIRDEGARLRPSLISAVNDHPEWGMLSSAQAGLRCLPARTTAFLIFPVDFPLVPAAEVRRLVTAFRSRAPHQLIFVPSFTRRRGHPVLFDAALAPEILALGPESSLRTVMAAHDEAVVHVPAADDRVLLDMDTPEDYLRCLAHHRR